MRGRYSAVVVALSVACQPLLARADDSNAHDEAVKVANEGAVFYEQGRFYDALGKFADAYRLYPALPLIINLVRTELKLGHCDQAYEYARRYSTQASAAPGTAKPNSELERVAGGCSAAEIDSTPAGASIEIDRERRGWSLTPWTGHLTVGTHRVVAHLAPYPDQQTTLVVTQGTAARLQIDFEKSEVKASVTAAPMPTDDKPDHSVARTLGWIAVAVGGAALVTGVGLYAAGRDQQTSLHTTPNPHGGTAGLKQLQTANGEVTGSAAPFVIGGLLTAGGVGIEIIF